MSDNQKPESVNEAQASRTASDKGDSSAPSGSVYRFSTIQQLVDEVPADRICVCMTELGKILQTTKGMAELTYMVAENLAKQDGKTIPPMPKQIIVLPEYMEWIDDGKGELEAHMKTMDGGNIGTLKITPNVES
jgi:hypothetical protein